MMCLTALTTEAQVITRETINSVYESAAANDNGNFVYNAEYQDDAIATLYVYRKHTDRSGRLTLSPAVMHQYDYDREGRLLSRTTMQWRNGQWHPDRRLDYQLAIGAYTVTCSHWNNVTATFDQPCDKMTYTMLTDTMVNDIFSYHRERPTDSFELTSQVVVDTLPFYMDLLLAQNDL